MFEIEETVTIEQPIERVWAFVMDESDDPLWQTTLNDVLEGLLGDTAAEPVEAASTS